MGAAMAENPERVRVALGNLDIELLRRMIAAGAIGGGPVPWYAVDQLSLHHIGQLEAAGCILRVYSGATINGYRVTTWGEKVAQGWEI